MTATIFDGKRFAREKEQKLIAQIPRLNKLLKRKPKLLAVGVGAEKDIAAYLSLKEKAAQRIGIDFEKKIFTKDAAQENIEKYLNEKARDKLIDSILLELPLPQKYNVIKLLSLIPPQKDHDGISPENLGNFLLSTPRFYPATVRAIRDILFVGCQKILTDGMNEESFLLENKQKPLAHLQAVVIGGGVELGKPLALMLSDLGTTVTLCRSTTTDLSQFTISADIIVSATGVPGLLNGAMIKEGALVIDAGINFVDGKVAGDVDQASVSQRAGFLTPVPGGVGPVTVISLFENMVESFM